MLHGLTVETPGIEPVGVVEVDLNLDGDIDEDERQELGHRPLSLVTPGGKLILTVFKTGARIPK